jgi:hypothetical protein
VSETAAAILFLVGRTLIFSQINPKINILYKPEGSPRSFGFDGVIMRR